MYSEERGERKLRYSGKIKELNHIIISDPSYDEGVYCRYERNKLKEKNWLADIDIYPVSMPVTDEIEMKGIEFYILLHRDKHSELKEEGTIQHLKGIKVEEIEIGIDTACVALGVNDRAGEIINARGEWQPTCALKTLSDGMFGTVREGKIGNEYMFMCISGYLDEDTGYSMEDIIDYLQYQLEITDLSKNMEKSYMIRQEKLLEKMSEVALRFRELTKEDPHLIEFFNKGDRFSNISFAEAYLAEIDLRNMQREVGNLEGEIEKSPYSGEQEKLIDKYTKLEMEYENIERKIEENIDMEI